ncbi:NAD(P)-binding protein [Pseudovirgaria hyperparasitica]|uniref:NAD(P)-binding protein n=1 Tax=Pseudovirgaria hyperparasitica TaxID=470096 RepID=A0A6A6W1E7_9PEZI|nr:NAD(P)-binding protein [Pseudovirgaria hyperparasitica]KAF2756732.1 NAD(P)-binding protein [Pseudovirgaria hyperparasitica]
MAEKIITIVGITGNQGASVAEAFLNEPGWKIRGISRDPTKASSKTWSDKGVEMVGADLDDVTSLKTAFKGSNAIFGVTDFWQQMRIPANQQKAKDTGKPINVISYDAEIQQGKNIVDAAQATADTLDILVLSVLSDSKKWSDGKITWNYHFEGKWRVVEYLQTTYPELYQKSSFFQPPFFMTNLENMMTPKETPNGYVLSFPTDGDKQIPMYHPTKDTGICVKALVKSSPGKNLMAYGTEISFDEIAQIWSQNLGKPVKYQRCTVEFMDKIMPGGMGMELGEMMEYISSPGYYGGDKAVKELGLITPKDLGISGLAEVRDFLKGKTLG